MKGDLKTYNIRQNQHILNSLFFNHDRNPAHHSALHTALILLSLASEKGFHDEVCKKDIDENLWLEKKLEILGHDVLENDGLVIAPGVLMQSLADNNIPENMIITKVDTRFSYPLLTPVDKGSKELTVEENRSENPGNPGITYNLKFYAADFYNNPITKKDTLVPIAEMNIAAFPTDLSSEEIFEKYVKEDFDKLNKKNKNPIHSLTHKTYISADDDECYWRSIQNKNPFRRNGNISQLELLAKLPRVLSRETDEIEENPPENYDYKTDASPFLKYAEKEKEYGMINGKTVEERAEELAKKRKYTYARQETVFDPRIGIEISEDFDLSIDLTKVKRGIHTFDSRAVSEKGVLFAGQSKVLASPLFTERVIRYLEKINYSVDELERFRHKKSI